jgi:hypothetical protein
VPSSPSPDEAAAIAAAIKRFRADTALLSDGETQRLGPWQRAALIEGVGAKRTVVDLEGEGGAKWLS